MNARTFSKLNKKFGVSPPPILTEIEETLAKDDSKALTLSTTVTSAVEVARSTGELPSLRDQEYMLFELKDLISSEKEALMKLQSMLRPGCSAAAYEVFSKISDSITGTLRELRELNKTIVDLMMFSGHKGPGQDEDEKGIKLTGSQLIDIITKAKETSEMNNIEAKFEVEEEKS